MPGSAVAPDAPKCHVFAYKSTKFTRQPPTVLRSVYRSVRLEGFNALRVHQRRHEGAVFPVLG